MHDRSTAVVMDSALKSSHEFATEAMLSQGSLFPASFASSVTAVPQSDAVDETSTSASCSRPEPDLTAHSIDHVVHAAMKDAGLSEDDDDGKLQEVARLMQQVRILSLI